MKKDQISILIFLLSLWAVFSTFMWGIADGGIAWRKKAIEDRDKLIDRQLEMIDSLINNLYGKPTIKPTDTIIDTDIQGNPMSPVRQHLKIDSKTYSIL
jgi:hypothetical protein